MLLSLVSLHHLTLAQKMMKEIKVCNNIAFWGRCISRLRPNRNDSCPCGSNKKFKHCCIELHNERMKWDALEDDLREKVDEYWKEFYHDRYVDQALAIYSKDVSCDMSDVFDRRLFFDWFIHDYVIPYKKDTIISLFIKECENDLDKTEGNTAIAWSKSELRFYEILEIKRGTGYEVKDIFNDVMNNNQFFVFDGSSSEKVNKYDIQYMRVYPVGSINTITGVGILMPRRYLPHIKGYVLHNFELFNKKGMELTESKIMDDNITASMSHDDIYYDYFKNESLSILKYLDSLELNPTVTTSQGDIMVLAKSRYIIKNKRRLISLLDSSGQFVRVENEGKRSIRYDWVEKMNKRDLVGTMADSTGLSEHLSLNTILWMPSSDSEEDSDRNYISTTNNNKRNDNDVNKEAFTSYRVLGNLSITGSNLIVDRLLENCNAAIRLLADKYLMYITDSYAEIPYPKKNVEDGMSIYNDEVVHDNTGANSELAVPPELKRQIRDYFQSYYEDWINMNIPALGGQTPVEVARTDSGKDLLRELLKEIENAGARDDKNGPPPFPVDEIKKQLCL
jgi:hypothetical protein